MLSKAQRQFLQDVKQGNVDGYSRVYRRQLKHQILKKKKKLENEKELLASDAKLVQEVLPMLEG